MRLSLVFMPTIPEKRIIEKTENTDVQPESCELKPLHSRVLCRRKEVIMLVRILSVIGLLACLAVFGVSQQKEIRHVPVKATSPASGPEMYTAYCAVCHGIDGTGKGPAAEALKVLQQI